MSLFGLILAGGKSSRMGFDKANIKYHGVEQVRWLNDLLTNYCEKVFVSGSPNKISGPYNFIEDIYERGGPMNGILSAFKKFPSVSWLVVPVDMPNLKLAIEYLLDNRNKEKFATCFINTSGFIEPLPVILEHGAHTILDRRFAVNDESLFKFLTEQDAVLLQPLSPDWLVNLNVPPKN